VFHNLADDVGLISMNVDPLPGCRVAPPETKLLKGLPVVSVGCSNGDKPTVQTLKITAINRYLGAENIEVGECPRKADRVGGSLRARGSSSASARGRIHITTRASIWASRPCRPCSIGATWRICIAGRDWRGRSTVGRQVARRWQSRSGRWETGEIDNGQLADARSRNGKVPHSKEGSRIPTTSRSRRPKARSAGRRGSR